MLRAGYAADWPPEILGRVGRKIQKANFAEMQNMITLLMIFYLVLLLEIVIIGNKTID